MIRINVIKKSLTRQFSQLFRIFVPQFGYLKLAGYET